LSWAKGDVGAFQLKGPYVLLVPGSTPGRPEKRWPAERYGALARYFFDEGYLPVVLGTAGEAGLGSKIRSVCPAAQDLTGRTNLQDIALLARHASAAIGNDTGPMHMIAPAGCPTYVLFSRHSDPERHAPFGKNVTTLQKNDLAFLAVEDVIEAVNAAGFRRS